MNIETTKIEATKTGTAKAGPAAPEQALDQPAVRADFRAAIERLGISQAEAARRAGLKESTVSLWLNGRYNGHADGVARDVRRWIASLEAREGVTRAALEAPAFQRTPTAGRIWAMLAQAQFHPDIVAIAGSPGIGKTITARAYRAAHPNVWIATLMPLQARPHTALAAIARAVGVMDRQPTTLFYSVGERVAAVGGLIVVDEAQHLKRPALDTLRSLHDQFGVGLALMGNAGLYGGLACSKGEDDFAQFFSRIGARKVFRGARADDIRMLLDAYGVTGAEERRFLGRVAGHMGALRALAKCLQSAALLAAGAEEPAGLAHYRAAWAQLNHLDEREA